MYVVTCVMYVFVHLNSCTVMQRAFHRCGIPTDVQQMKQDIAESRINDHKLIIMSNK